MAAYYHAPPRHPPQQKRTPNAQAESYHQSPSVDLADSPTYIFPSPPSVPPSPASVYSERSDLSAFSFDLDSQAQFLLSPSSLSSDYQDLSLDLDFSPLLDPTVPMINVEPANDVQERCLTRQVSPLLPRRKLRSGSTTRRFQHPLVRVSASPVLISRSNQEQIRPLETCHPLPSVQLPFLSHLCTLLGIESSTVDLLMLPTSSSLSLPSTEKTPPMVDKFGDIEVTPPTHGVEKLISVLTAEINCKSMRQGFLSLESSSDVTLGLSPLSGLWDLVVGIVANGGKVLQGLYHLRDI